MTAPQAQPMTVKHRGGDKYDVNGGGNTYTVTMDPSGKNPVCGCDNYHFRPKSRPCKHGHSVLAFLSRNGPASAVLDAMTEEQTLALLKGPTPKVARSEWVAELPGKNVEPISDIGAPQLTTLADVKAEKVDWLWPSWIPLGKVTIVDGDPGLGKSTLLLDLAARVTKGGALPDGSTAPCAAVVLLTAEDGLADTVRPRLDNMGADMTRVVALTGVAGKGGAFDCVTLPLHLPALKAAIDYAGACLVIVDPFTAYLDGQVNSRIDHDVRRAIAPLARLAEEMCVAIILVRHLNKTAGGPAIYRGGGSIGLIGAARAGLLVAQDPDDETPDSPRRVLAVVKSNLAARPQSMNFSVVGGDNGASRIEWTGVSSHSANQLLADNGDQEDRSDLKRCMEWLGPYVNLVSRTSKEAVTEARAAGFSEMTLRRAKQKLGIHSVKIGFGGNGSWVLQGPNTPTEQTSDPGIGRGDAWEPDAPKETP